MHQDETDESDREAALITDALRGLSAPAAISTLCDIMQEIDGMDEGAVRLRRYAAEALGRLIEPTLPTLMQLFPQEKQLPAELVYAFRGMGSDALPELRAALRDQRRDVRTIAAGAIGYFSDLSDCSELLNSLNLDIDHSVRRSAAYSLVRLGHPGGVRTLLDYGAFVAQVQSHSGRETVEEIVSLIDKIGLQAVPVLIDALNDWQAAKIAARILRQWGDAETLPRRILTDPDLSIEQKIDFLHCLRKVRYKGNEFIEVRPNAEHSAASHSVVYRVMREVIVRYDLPDVLEFCRSIAQEEGDAADAARQIVNHLTLLRSAAVNPTQQAVELMRPAGPGVDPAEPNAMLRATESPQTSSTPPARRTLWQKLRGA